MSDLKAIRGEAVTAEKWNRLADRLPETLYGFSAGGFAMNRVQCLVKNTSGNDRDIGEFLAIDSWDGPDGSAIYEVPKNVVYQANDPAWHSSISRLVVLAEPIPNEQVGLAVLSGHCVAKLSSGSVDEDFVMLDPASINEAKSSDTGIARLEKKLSGGNYGLIVFRDSSRLWRYQLTEDSQAPATSAAKLLKLNGTEFAPSIDLSDPTELMEDQISGDEGWCIHVGNKFYAIQAPC